MNRHEKASDLMKVGGFSCSQAVLEVFCDDFGVDIKTARMLSAGMGGGLKTGDICGLATGGIMALGMKYGQVVAGDVATKKAMGPIVKDFIAKFKLACNGYTCEELLGVNTSTPEGAAINAEKKLTSKCTDLLKSTIEILEEML